MKLNNHILLIGIMLLSGICLNCKQKSNIATSKLDINRVESSKLVESVILNLDELDNKKCNKYLSCLDSAIILDSTFPYSYYYKSIIYLFLKDTLNSIINIDKAISLDSSEFHFWRIRGTILDIYNHRSSAFYSYNKALNILDSLLTVDDSNQNNNFDRLLTLCLLDKKDLALIELTKLKSQNFFKIQPNAERFNEIVTFDKNEYLKKFK